MSAADKIWSNWSGSLKFRPAEVKEPKDEEALRRVIRRALREGKKIRVAGAGHSSSPLVHTKETLVSLKNFRSVESSGSETTSAWLGSGLKVSEGGKKLLEKHRLSFHNTGDVDVQTVAGAISTGTHGTGIGLRNLSSMLTACRMVCADGELREFSEEQQGKDFFDAMRVSLGSFGIMSSMRLKLQPAFRLERSEWCAGTEACMENLDRLVNSNRNFDFYWYPRSDLVKLRLLNEPGEGMQDLPFAKKAEANKGWAIEVLPKQRDLQFDEMEYALPLENGAECFLAIRERIRKKWRKIVAWRVLFRTVAADDFYLSPCYGRKTVTISLHQNAGLPFWDYFRDIEPVFREFHGRPHWGKKHTLKKAELSQLYPRWNDFLRIRDEMDPGRVFINGYLAQIF